MSRTVSSALLAAVMLACSAPWPCAEDTPRPTPEGVWQGTIQGVLRLVVHVGRDGVGSLTGTLDSPDQGAMGLPIDTLTFTGDSLRFVMRRLTATYRARLSSDGTTLRGQWSQRGLAIPLDLKRGDAPAELRRPQDPKPPYPYRVEEVAYENLKDGVKLAGTLTLPSSGGPFPAVLLISGSGPQNRDGLVFGHRPFLVLADHLTRKGIAVLRVDDRGVGSSTGDQRNATSEDYANDALAGVSFLKGRKKIDPRRIGLIGHSEGGMVAPMAATRSRDVAFIVLLAGPGLPGDSLLLLQNVALLRASGEKEDAIAAQRAAMRHVLDLVRQGADSTGVFKAVRDLVLIQLASVPAERRASFGSADSLAIAPTRGNLSPWVRYLVGFDPRPTLARVTIPVLAITGGKDLQVVPAENLAGIKASLERARNRDATVRELPGLNHLFQRCSTCTVAEYALLEETIAPEVLETISQWIGARTGAP